MPTAQPEKTLRVTADQAGPLVAVLRKWLPDQPWSRLRKLIRGRRVTVNGTLCLDESRKLREDEQVAVWKESLPPPPADADVTVVYCDRELVIVEKPARMVTLRHRAELGWPRWRRDLQPTLDEVVPRLLGHPKYHDQPHRLPRVYPVHRIDRDTSGLLVMARSETVQAQLIEQFAAHNAVRVYHTIIPGWLSEQTIRSQLVRNRGDGLRGSTTDTDKGYPAVTHIRPRQRINDNFSELECRLETGRTHQIRIHLAELGHPVCGDLVYRGPVDTPPLPDTSEAPRLCLHASQIGLTHPATGEVLHFTTDWPRDIARFLLRLRGGDIPAGGASPRDGRGATDARRAGPASTPRGARGGSRHRPRSGASDANGEHRQ